MAAGFQNDDVPWLQFHDLLLGLHDTNRTLAIGHDKLIMRSWPLYLWWHRREDRIDIAAGLQSEDGAAVVEQVELDIAAAPDQLLLAVGFRPGAGEIAPDDIGIDLQEGAADILREGEVGVPVAAVVPVVEDAADAARLFAVRQIEILVAPLLVLVVIGNAVRLVAGVLHRGMEGDGVGILLRA